MDFYIFLFIISVLFSIVGHGGASGYLALFALYGFAANEIKSTALILNLVVSLIAFWSFYKGKFFDKKIFIPIAITSIPMSFVGGLIQLDGNLYKNLLGYFILFAAILFLADFKIKKQIQFNTSQSSLYLIGAILGFIAGLLGIGGGILLSPLLIFLNLTDQKETAAISSLFIFVNSFSGLMGLTFNGLQVPHNLIYLIIIVVIGGSFGSYLGVQKLNKLVLQRILGVVLLLAAYKLIVI